MNRIGIIGGGFTGTMTAVQLIEQAREPFELVLVNEGGVLNKGIAYDAYSDRHLLNVVAKKMSAFPDRPSHFVDHLLQRLKQAAIEQDLVANAFLPRRSYGDYLQAIWARCLSTARSKSIPVQVIEDRVVDLELSGEPIGIIFGRSAPCKVDRCVIATGNHLPRDPLVRTKAALRSARYFRDPWKLASVKDVRPDLPVLIIGNGLTMVDTVLGLIEQGHTGEIHSISPHGFNILPHRHNGMHYSALVEELNEGMDLIGLVRLVNKHIRKVRKYGISAEPVIDSLRPHTQRIWRSLSDRDKRIFMSRFRHLWGVARHRIPLHTHDLIQQLRIEGRLQVRAGRILDMQETDGSMSVEYHDKRAGELRTLLVQRVINCTGPASDLLEMEDHFLKRLLLNGMIQQDPLKLGIRADISTFRPIAGNGSVHQNLFAVGSLLRGELWESTAVNELRSQAAALAEQLLMKDHEQITVEADR